tara:strand:- start:4502 stop:4852 length:351 start_codon:yes stop_codon:yes gene_type:complete
MLPIPIIHDTCDEWIENLDLNDIILLLQYAETYADNSEKIIVKDNLTNLFKNIRVIKNYYNSKKRTSEETMFDNIIPIKSTNRQMSKRQKFTHQSSISDNCGRSQCEMRFNGCSHI